MQANSITSYTKKETEGQFLKLNKNIWEKDLILMYQYEMPDTTITSCEVSFKKLIRGKNYLLEPDTEVINKYFERGIPKFLRLALKENKNEPQALIKQWDFKEEEWIDNPDVIPYPSRMIGFSLTNQCNLNCTKCWQKDRKLRLYLSKEEIAKVLKSVKRLGYPPIYLWGGEPLLHPELPQIVRIIKENGFFSIINTNGTLLEGLAEEIIDSGVDMIIVSLDGPEDIQDRICGRHGAFQKIVNGLKKLIKLRKHRPLIIINCVIHDLNYRRLPEMVSLKNELGIDYLEFQFLMFYSVREKQKYKEQFMRYFGFEPSSIDGYPSDCGDINVKELCHLSEKILNNCDQKVRFFPYILDKSEAITDYFEKPFNLTNSGCDSILKTFWVEANGDVVPCSNFSDYTVGNIYHIDFFTIWNGESYLAFRSKLREGLFSICPRCCDLYKTDLFQKGRR